MKLIKTLLVISFVFLLSAKEIEAKEGYLIHLSSNDPHRVSMALTFAQKMSAQNDVLVFVDVDGVLALLKDSESIRYKNFEPTRTIIDQLLKDGIKIVVCPMCLEAKGYTKYNLISGIQIVDPSDFSNFTSGRIITLDY